MKKVYTENKFKIFNRGRSKKAIEKKDSKRKNNNYNKKNSTTKKSFVKREVKTYLPIEAPAHFSLINNTDETIAFFSRAHKHLKRNKRVLLDLSGVQKLTTDAIAIQIAKIKDIKFHCNTEIRGNAPDEEKLKKLFLQSGFYDYVLTDGAKPINQNKLLIHEITNNKVEPDRAKDACLLGIRHTFQNEKIFEPLYNILIEIMQNTNNHAGYSRGNYDWWMHVFNHPDSRKTSYTFLDLGIGIFESLPVKSFKRDFFKLIGRASNVELVPQLFSGKIRSRTALPERGKGIPQVYECSKDDAFTKFILISNDVYADMKNDNYRELRAPFAGTLFYWELDNI